MLMSALEILDTPQQASMLLDETRLALVRELAEPDSASGVARRLDLPRQRVNYHLRELEKAGFLELVKERKKGNCTERLVRATASAYVVNPAAMAGLDPNPARFRDRFSLLYLVAVASRTIRDLATLASRARSAGKRVATLTLQVDVRLATGADRNAFAEDVTNEIARLVREYHDAESAGGRVYRLVVGAYPAITKDDKGRDLPPDELDLSLGELR